MSNPLLQIKPNQVSRDLGSYVTYIYGSPKVGKSRFAAEFPDALFLATEPTQTAIPGIFIQPCMSWTEIKKTVRLLKDEEVQKTYKTIVIDTIDLAAIYCERYICNQAGVEDIKDIPYGAGYGRVEREFETVLNQIKSLGYGLVMISHVTTGVFTREDGSEYNKLTPAISSKRCKAVAENLANIYGWIHIVDDGTQEGHRVLTLRAPNDSVSGGNHFKYLVPEVELSYAALTQAINDAIDKEEIEFGNPNLFTNERKEIPRKADIPSFDELMTEFKNLTSKIQDATGDDFRSKWAPKITGIVNKYLGVGKKVNDCTEEQSEQLVLILDDLKEMVGNGL